jgi:anti-sigma-K factor RskA
MSPDSEKLTAFEQRSRAVLEESLTRIDGRIRSRLNQARQAAVAETAARRPVFWRFFTLMPAAGAAAAALLVTMVLWHRQPMVDPLTEGTHAAVEDLDLLADGEGLDLVEDGDGSGSFYEWAVDQSDTPVTETNS